MTNAGSAKTKTSDILSLSAAQCLQRPLALSSTACRLVEVSIAIAFEQPSCFTIDSYSSGGVA
jgi:hypothetical protein